MILPKRHKKSGFAVAIAWPATQCKRAGAWYDLPMHLLGVSKDGYYKVGHAAIILIDGDSGECHYFDFGRYHAPHGYGRVRSAVSDHELAIATVARFAKGSKDITNLDEILGELHKNPSSHGTGTTYGAVSKIDFNLVMKRANDLQDLDFIPYGPFVIGGTNCSRFVSDMILAGLPSAAEYVKLKLPLTISPTPMWNLRAVRGNITIAGGVARSGQLTEEHQPEMATA